MKKLFVLLTLVLFAFLVEAQTVKTFAGTAADTLTASATKAYVIPIGSNVPMDFTVTFWTDHVSGTDTYTATLTYSLDGFTYYSLLSCPSESHAAGTDNLWSWSNKNIYQYAAAADDTTASGTLRYYNVFVDTPIFAKYLKIALVATSATQKSTIYGYYMLYPRK